MLERLPPRPVWDPRFVPVDPIRKSASHGRRVRDPANPIPSPQIRSLYSSSGLDASATPTDGDPVTAARPGLSTRWHSMGGSPSRTPLRTPLFQRVHGPRSTDGGRGRGILRARTWGNEMTTSVSQRGQRQTKPPFSGQRTQGRQLVSRSAVRKVHTGLTSSNTCACEDPGHVLVEEQEPGWRPVLD